MRAAKYPAPIPAAFVTTLFDGDTDNITARLYALGEETFDVPVSLEEKDGRTLPLHDVDAARKIKNRPRDKKIAALTRDRSRIEYDPSALPSLTKDALLNLVTRAEVKNVSGELLVRWRGVEHRILPMSNEREGTAHDGDFREPGYEVLAVAGTEYVVSRDWDFPHVVGETSWHLVDLSQVEKILKRPMSGNRPTNNITHMQLSQDVPFGISEALFVRASWGFSSSPNSVGEFALPDRHVVLPAVVDFLGTAVSGKHPDIAVGLIFKSSNVYFVPFEQKRNPGGQIIQTILRCDEFKKANPLARLLEVKPPYKAEGFEWSGDVTPSEAGVVSWAAQKIYAATADHEVKLVTRDRTQPEILAARHVADISVKRNDEKIPAGVVYKIEGNEWFVKFWGHGHSDDSALDPSKPRHFFVSEAEKIVGRPTDNSYSYSGFSTFEKAGRNVRASLETVIRRDYSRCFEEAKCVIK